MPVKDIVTDRYRDLAYAICYSAVRDYCKYRNRPDIKRHLKGRELVVTRSDGYTDTKCLSNGIARRYSTAVTFIKSPEFYFYSGIDASPDEVFDALDKMSDSRLREVFGRYTI